LTIIVARRRVRSGKWAGGESSLLNHNQNWAIFGVDHTEN
jgi:hypothetical protein